MKAAGNLAGGGCCSCGSEDQVYPLALGGLASGVYFWEVSERGGRKQQGNLINEH